VRRADGVFVSPLSQNGFYWAADGGPSKRSGRRLMTRALQTIPQEPEADTSAEIYLTGAYFLLPLSLPFGSVLLLGLVALRVPGAQILAVGWYIFFLSFGPALIAVWCLYTY